MKLKMACKHLNLNPQIKEHTKEKSHRFEKYLRGNFDVSWVFNLEGGMHIAALTVNGKNFSHHAEAKTTNLYSSIDQASHKMERQINKTKNKVKGHRGDKTGVNELEDLDLFKKTG